MAQLLHVVSWNVREKNPNTVQNAHRLLRLYPQNQNTVICLQEVSEAFLNALKSTAGLYDFRLCWGLDRRRLCAEGSTRDCYLVIMSNARQSEEYETWNISDTSKRPLVTWLTIPLLRMLGKWDDTAIRSDALGVCIRVGKQPLFIVNAHLSLTDPVTRQSEFEKCLRRSHFVPRILCGDFNVLEGKWRAANLLIGGNLPYALYRSERKEFDALVAEAGFLNPLAGKKTHKGGQVDHILVPYGMEVAGVGLVPSRFGSDHHPVRVDLLLDRA